jgi:CO dehydrogenase nickel-insertion accessory protein CooC1
MKKITVEVTKEFFKNYRNYKIDLVMGNCKIDMDYELFRHVLEMSKLTIHQITDELDEYDLITIDTEGHVSHFSRKKETQEMMKRMNALAGI